MNGQDAVVVGLGMLATLLGIGGIIGALRTRRRRTEIAPTYGSTGGIVYTVVQLGCSGALLVGGVILMTVVILAKL